MREILFKAKRLDNGEWVETYSVLKGTFEATPAYYMLAGSGKGKCEIEIPTGNICGINGIEFCRVDPETVCQFTGLTDKNGVKIFENDILQGNGNPKDLNAVVFGKLEVINAETLGTVDNMIGWHYKPLETDTLSKVIPFCLPMPLTERYIKICEFEVISNIFDNPELLKGGEVK